MNALKIVASGIAQAQNLSAASHRFSQAAREKVLETIIIAKENGLIARAGRPSLNPMPLESKARMILLAAYIGGKSTVTADEVVQSFIKDGYVSANKGGIQAAARVALSNVKNNSAFDTGGKYQTMTRASKFYSHVFSTLNLETGELEIIPVFNGNFEAQVNKYSSTHKVMSVREIKKDSDLDNMVTMFLAVSFYNVLARKYGEEPNYKAYSDSFNKAWDEIHHQVSLNDII